MAAKGQFYCEDDEHCRSGHILSMTIHIYTGLGGGVGGFGGEWIYRNDGFSTLGRLIFAQLFLSSPTSQYPFMLKIVSHCGESAKWQKTSKTVFFDGRSVKCKTSWLTIV